jgi:hypothetical protein
VEALPVPKQLYEKHDDFIKQLEKRKEENKKATEEKFKEAQPPSFMVEARPSNKEKVRHPI